MTVIADAQRLEPGTEVKLIEVDGEAIGGPLLRFHGYTTAGTITWQGNVYSPWPLQLAGFERVGAQQPIPTITVGNIDGSISYLCNEYDDMAAAQVRVHKTFAEYLDGEPGADPSAEFPVDIWYIDRKSNEDNTQVQFELSNAIDFDGQMLPGRQIIADTCSWVSIGGYRGPYCGYTGAPVADVNNVPTSDPTKDMCSGCVAACILRFGANNQIPFGSFPAAALVS